MSPNRRLGLRAALVLLLALILFSGFTSLGVWQLYRLDWKLDLIDRLEQQLQRPPIPVPGREHWHSIDKSHEYLPVTVTGIFMHDLEAYVQAMTSHGTGYWVITPLQSEQGFVVLVNRGFVDAARKDPASRAPAQSAGPVEITGLLRLTEPKGRFLGENQPEADRWFTRDVMAIAARRGLAPDNVAPYFVDAGKQPNSGGWPVGGLTVVQFRNAHLGYALTWFALALMSGVGGWLVLRTHQADEETVTETASGR